MKVLFLDIDGVLASLDWLWATQGLKESNPDRYGYSFDPRCVKNLKYLFLTFPKLKIVISSSWKQDGLDNIKGMWKLRELPGEVIDITPKLNKKIGHPNKYKTPSRGEEIQAWLCLHPEVHNYVILDDDVDMLSNQKSRFVNTNSEFGVTAKDIFKVITIFNRKKNKKEVL